MEDYSVTSTQITEQTITATEAANRINISPDVLRMWSQPEQFGRFLAAPKNAAGRRRYTEHDIAVCQLIKRWHEDDNLPYREIISRFEKYGVDRCLQMAIGTEATNVVLQEETERLRRQLSDLLTQHGQLQEIARQWHQARAISVAVLQDLEARRQTAHRELDFLEQAEKRAARHLQEAHDALHHIGLWAWLTGGRQRALLHLQEARLAYQEATDRVATMRVTMGHINFLQIRRVLGLPTGDDLIDVSETAAAKEPG